jgi:hypothetical protein
MRLVYFSTKNLKSQEVFPYFFFGFAGFIHNYPLYKKRENLYNLQYNQAFWKGGAHMTKGFKMGDLLAVAIVLVLATVCFLAFLPRGNEEAACARIYQNGKLLMSVSLDEPQQFTVQGDYCNTVTVKDGTVAITASDCPGQDCIHSGCLDSPGRSLVCLPNALEIRVVSGESDVDFVVG